MSDFESILKKEFLIKIRDGGIEVLIYTMKGMKLLGKIHSFDNELIFLSQQIGLTLIYQHDVAFIGPKNINYHQYS